MFTMSILIDLSCIALVVFIAVQLMSSVVVGITAYKAWKKGF